MSDAPGAIPLDAQVVHVRRLSRAFDGRGVLHEVDLDIRSGELVALVGRVGSGKSTLLRILARLDTEFDGEVRLPERPAVTFQDGRLLPWRRVLDNVQLGRPGLEARASALRLLDEVGLTAQAQAWPRELTGGEAQRAGLARAFTGRPELLLMDEPFAALDALTRIRLRRLVRALFERYQPGVLLVTHDVDEAILLADRVVVLTDGSVSRDQVIDLPRRGRRSHPGFATMRRELLIELGVGDDDGG